MGYRQLQESKGKNISHSRQLLLDMIHCMPGISEYQLRLFRLVSSTPSSPATPPTSVQSRTSLP